MKIKKIMFVCHGNICRSPMAEFIFSDMLKKQGISQNFRIASSATSCEEIINGVGHPIYPPARKELELQGIEIYKRYAVQLTKEDARNYDMIVVMEDYNILNVNKIIEKSFQKKVWKLLDFEHYHDNSNGAIQRLEGRNISDPWYSGRFHDTYQDIVAGCKGLLAYCLDS